MEKNKKVLNQFERTDKKYTCPTGTECDKTYEMTINENGEKKLKQKGYTNRYEKVQSHAEECKIENILARATVDPSVLNARTGQYIDTVDMPKSLAEAQMLMQKVENEFNSLPVEVRKEFNNSAEEYIAAYGGKKWAEALGLVGLVKEAHEENATEQKEEIKKDE